MDGKTLRKTAMACAGKLPSAALEQPFGPEVEVFKVQGKVFALFLELKGQPVVNLKVEPEEGVALRANYPEITPGYHMNKRHWITVAPGEGVDRRLLEELVTESYCLVVGTLPKAKRPVDPHTFGADRAGR